MQQALIALRGMGAFDLNCPCPPLSVTPQVRATSTTLSPTSVLDSATTGSRTRDPQSTAAATDANAAEPTGVTHPGAARVTAPSWSPCPPKEGKWPCPPPLGLNPAAVSRLAPTVKNLLDRLHLSAAEMPLPQLVSRLESELASVGRVIAKHNTGVGLKVNVIAGRAVLICVPPRNSTKECGCGN